MSATLTAALEYAARRWPAFPVHSVDEQGRCTCGDFECERPGKHPISVLVPNGLKNATCDPQVIAGWFATAPWANVGVVTGFTGAGLLGFDIDPRHGGDDAWHQLVRRHSEIPRTLEVFTGGGGRHLLFRRPSIARAPALGNSTGSLPEGIDVRCDGGYIIAPPSLHASGRRYEWSVDGHPDELQPADPPEWLLDMLLDRDGRAPASPLITEGGEPIPEGRRNKTLARHAGLMRRYGHSEAVIRATLLALNVERCRPPLSEREVEKIAHSVARYEPAEPIVPEVSSGSQDVDPDDTSVGRIRRALFEDTESTRDGAAVVRDPVPGTGGLLWRGIAHSFFGDRNAGKSVVTVIVTVAAAVAGERVLYLDRENGSALTRSLVEGVLEAHQEWPDVLEAGRWDGRHYPAFDREWQPADYAEAIAGLGYTGVVYDSVREVISELGGDPNADVDYSALQRVLVTPLIKRGLFVILLDNVGHVEKGRPKGTGAKLDAVPIGYQVRTTTEFGPVTEGAVEIKCMRSRYGDIGREWVVHVGAGRFDLPEPREESPDERAARELEERFERFARGVVTELAKDGPLGWKELMKRVKGARTDTRRRWLTRIVAEPERGVVHDERSGYSLRIPTRGDPPGEPPAPLEGRGALRVNPGGGTSEEEIVEAIAIAFDATEIDGAGEPMGGGS